MAMTTTRTVTYVWPPQLGTGPSKAVAPYGKGVILPRVAYPRAFVSSEADVSGVAVTLTPETLVTAPAMNGGFADACTDGGTGVYLLGTFGDVSYFPNETGKVSFAIPSGQSSDTFVSAVYNLTHSRPYFAASNGDILTVSGVALTKCTTGWGEQVNDMDTDGTSLFATLPESGQLGTYTFTSDINGTVSKVALPVDDPGFVAASELGVAVGGTSPSILGLGGSAFVTNPIAPFAALIDPVGNKINLLTGTEPNWALGNVVSGASVPTYAAWTPSGQQLLITDPVAGELQILSLQTGRLVFEQAINLVNASHVAVSPDGLAAFVVQPSLGVLTVLTQNVGVWSVSTNFPLTSPSSLAFTSNSEIVVGVSGGVVWLAYAHGSLSLETQVTGLGFTPTDLTVDPVGNVYVTGGSGTASLAVVTKIAGIVASTTWTGDAKSIYYQQGQIVVTDDANTLVRVFAVSFKAGTLTQRFSLTGPSGVRAIGSTSPSVWLCGTTESWQYVFTAPFTLSARKAGAVAIWDGSLFTTIPLAIAHQPSAAVWDSLGSLWVATLQNDLYQFTPSGTLLFSTFLTPNSQTAAGMSPSLGISDLAWVGENLWASSMLTEALLQLYNSPFQGIFGLRIAGHCTVHVDTIVKNPGASARLNGVGRVQINATLVPFGNFTAFIQGQGLLVANASHTPNGAAVIAGSGLLVATGSSINLRNIYINAVGQVTINATMKSGINSINLANINVAARVNVSAARTTQAVASINARGNVYAAWSQAATVFNPADQQNMASSNQNLTTTTTTVSGKSGVRSTTGKASGKWYAEYTVGSFGSNQNVGICTKSYPLNDPSGLGLGGTDNKGIAWVVQTTGQSSVMFEGSTVGTGLPAWATGGTLNIATDFDREVIYFGYNGAYGPNGSHNPANGIGGYSFSSLGLAGQLFFLGWDALQSGSTPLSMTADFGEQVFNNPPPTGFLPWDALPPGVPTALIASNVTGASLTLSWTAPIVGTASINYQVNYRQSGAGAFVPFGSPTTATQVQLTGLTSTTSYDFFVSASNAYGSSQSAVYTTSTVSESPNGKVVISTSDSIVDAQGNVWTLTAGAQIAENGVINPVTSQVVELLYWNHTVWQLNTGGFWYAWTGSTWTVGSTTSPIVESNNGTTVTDTLGQITDGRGVSYTLTGTPGTYVVNENNVADNATSNAAIIVYWNHATYYENTSGVWFAYTGTPGSWIQISADPRSANFPGPPTNLQATSITSTTATIGLTLPTSGSAIDVGGIQLQYKINTATTWTNGPTIPIITPGHGSITDTAGTIWTVTTGAQLTRNGTVDSTTANVVFLCLLNGVIWQVNTAGAWYEWLNNTWSGGSTISPITATGQTISGLLSNTPYNVQAYSFNSAGPSLPSTAANFTTLLTSSVGDATGVQANRIADMMERMGYNVFPGVNSVASTAYAYKWLAGNTTMTMWTRLRNTGNDYSVLTTYCPQLHTAVGTNFSLCIDGVQSIESGVLSQLATLAAESHNGSGNSAGAQGWLRISEGYNVPDSNGETGTQVSDDDVARFNALSSYTEIAIATASIDIQFPQPETEPPLVGFQSAADISRTNASCSVTNFHYYPNRNIDFTFFGIRDGDMNDAYIGVNTYYGVTRATMLSEWHPSFWDAQNPNIGNAAWGDPYDGYLSYCFILSAYRRGFINWCWSSLFDPSPSDGTGMWPGDARTSTPRGTAYVIRAMFQLLGEFTGNKKLFSVGNLNYSISGLPPLPVVSAGDPPGSNAGGQHMLFQNSTGRFGLFVWDSEQSPGGTPVTVTVTFAHPVGRVVHYNLTDNQPQNLQPVDSQSGNVTSYSFPVGGNGHLLLIDYNDVSLSAPTEPLGPSVTSVGTGSVNVSIFPPTTVGSGALTYNWQRSLSGQNNWTTVGTSTTGVFTYTGLVSGTAYDFRAYCTNTAGQGPVSTTISGTPN